MKNKCGGWTLELQKEALFANISLYLCIKENNS